MEIWQFISGGGEDAEDAFATAKRESNEEANISYESKFVKLDAFGCASVDYFSPRAREYWGEKQYVIPIYTYAVEAREREIAISREHTEYRWVDYGEAEKLLHFDLDKAALFELNERLKNGDI